MIEFKCGEKGRLEFKIKTPAVFSGGGPGYLEIKSDEIKIFNRKVKLKRTGEIINFEILSSNRLKMKLFEEYFIFKKEISLTGKPE